MAIALRQKATVGTTLGLSNSVSFGSTTLVGSLLVLILADQGGFIIPTVSGGGTYSTVPNSASTSTGGGGFARMYYTICTSGTTSISFDNTAQGASIGVAFAYEFTGVLTPVGSVYDTSAYITATGGAASTTITTAGADELLLETHVVGGSNPSGYSPLDSATGTGYSGSVHMASSYLVPGLTGSNSVSWGTGSIGGLVVAYKPLAAATNNIRRSVLGSCGVLPLVVPPCPDGVIH